MGLANNRLHLISTIIRVVAWWRLIRAAGESVRDEIPWRTEDQTEVRASVGSAVLWPRLIG